MRGIVVLVVVLGCGEEARTDDSLDDLIEYVDASIDGPPGPSVFDGSVPVVDANPVMPVVLVEPMFADFGLVPITGPAVELPFRIGNFGGDPIELEGIEVLGGVFTQVRTTCPPLLFPGEPCELVIAALPTTAEMFFGEVHVRARGFVIASASLAVTGQDEPL